MIIHHTKHHGGYVVKLNTALEGYAKFQQKSVEDLLKDLAGVQEGDTVFGAAMRADWRGSNWYIKASSYSVDSCQLKLGYQVRQKDGTWTGAAGETMSVITDSLVLVPGTPTQKFVHVPSAAWVRPVVIGISLTDKVRIDTLKALNRVL